MFSFLMRTHEERIFAKELQKILGFKPKQLSYYQDAFRHSSVCNRYNQYNSNERLEYIGDAILTMTVSNIIYPMFPKAKEGELTIIRSTIVSRKSLNRISNDLKLLKLLRIKEDKKNPPLAQNAAGNCLEALAGAVFLDRGYKYALKFTEKIVAEFFPNLKNYNQKKNDDNFKSAILSFSQKNKINLEFLTYENRESNEKLSHFICELYLAGTYIADGKAWNKRDAEQIAARRAIEILKKQKKFNN
jgi:ribonuclease-3